MHLLLQNPLAYYALLALGLGACLYLFVSVKVDLQRINGKLRTRCEGVEQRLGAVETAQAEAGAHIAEWTSRCKFVEDTVALLAPCVPAGQSLNVNKRPQVLRLAKRGTRSDEIATELGIPKNEVDLLLKVHRAVVRLV